VHAVLAIERFQDDLSLACHRRLNLARTITSATRPFPRNPLIRQRL
jgi:hypothetical protein